jgi:NTE family protein
LKKTLGLALGSGGSRGVAHIGFLKALEEVGVKPDYITGSSMGAVVGAAYAAGLTVEQMKEAVYSLRLLDLITFTGKRGGVSGTKKIRELLIKYIGDITFADLKIPFRCYAVDMISQNLIEFSTGSVIDAVVASASIPVVFHPLEKDGMRLIDGGILERVPVSQVKAMGADVVVGVDVLGLRDASEDAPNVLKMLIETIDVMDNHRTARRKEDFKDIIDFWLEPDLGTMSQYDLRQIRFAYEKGYELGKNYANDIRKALKRPHKSTKRKYTGTKVNE